MIKVTEKHNAIIFGVRVIPRSSKSEIVGEYDGLLKVKLSSPPVDGAANSELVKLFAKEFGVAKSDIEIVGGHTSKIKQLEILGLNSEIFFRLLAM